MSTPNIVSSIVARFAQLKQLSDRARRLGEMDGNLRAALPSPLSEHVHLATLRDGCLVLHADGAAWAAELRFKAPEILEKLAGNPDFLGVRSVRVRNVKRDAEAVAAATPAAMGAAAAAALDSLAATIDDPALSAALTRLAHRGRRRDAD